MTLIKVTHANHKSVVYIMKNQVGGWYHSPGNACTHVVLVGGAVFPITETIEQFAARMSGSLTDSVSAETSTHGVDSSITKQGN